MEFNLVATGIELIGTTVKELNISNNIVDVDKDGEKKLGLNINEPEFEKIDDRVFAQLLIDFEVEINQDEEEKCKIQLSLEGAFISDTDVSYSEFKDLVMINGAAALIGIARGKIETISANVFNNGKIVIPFVNVVDYYKSFNE